jgi:heme exporter protein D
MDAVNHFGFIAAAYAAAVIVVGALIAWVMLDYRAQRRMLLDLDRRGVSRRSTPPRADGAMAQAKEQA